MKNGIETRKRLAFIYIYFDFFHGTVNVTRSVGVGNCLAVRNNDSYKYIARDCSATAFQICLKGE